MTTIEKISNFKYELEHQIELRATYHGCITLLDAINFIKDIATKGDYDSVVVKAVLLETIGTWGSRRMPQPDQQVLTSKKVYEIAKRVGVEWFEETYNEEF